MVDHVSRGARPRRVAGCCHWDMPLVVTENFLFPHAMVLPGTHTCCQCQAPAPITRHSWCEQQLPVLIAPQGFSTSPWLLRGDWGQQRLLTPHTSNSPAHTPCWHQPQLLCAISGASGAAAISVWEQR
uniref:Uncharacterized protein n=1 Tax=Myotis myotis TaxID=51298 RepID=A0A7J8ALA2_MYOMY|nr:hypothetical protein mMyoMyo1_007856 [Myotis myotis]